jgi:FKBP-type peptidyl-prolyl cis-trans isomerase FkpA
MKKYIVKFVVAFAVIPFVLSSCLDSDYTPPDYEQILSNNLGAVDKVQLDKDKEIIDDSLADWGVTGVQIETRGGVRYTIQQVGTGAKPVLANYISVKYKVRLMQQGPDAIPFDESDNLNYELFRLILGWQTTLPLLPVGTRATLYVPSGLAYGPFDQKNTNGDIVVPKNSNLIFDIELLGIQ